MRLSLAVVALVCAGAASVSSAQPPEDGIPDQAFSTVHVMAVQPEQIPALKTAVDEFNAEFRKQGCPSCTYRMSRRIVGSQGPYNVLITANWPGRSEYLRLHDSASYNAVLDRNPIFNSLQATQIYGRFVDVP